MAGALSSARPAFAQEVAQDVKVYAENMKNDAGAIGAVTELFGKDAPIVKKFQLGVKLGEFITRVSQGDVLDAAIDLAKYELEQVIDTIKGKLFGPFAAAADLGKWLGEKGRNMHFVSVFNAGYEIYKRENGQGEFYISEIAGWWDIGGKKFEKEKGDLPAWKKVFKNLYEAEKLAAGIKQEDIQKVEQVKKEVKKEVFITFFKTKYIGMPADIAEELAELIVNKASNVEIEKFIDKHKNTLNNLSIAKPANQEGAASGSGICETIKDKDSQDFQDFRKNCEEILAEIVDMKNQVFSNKITYYDYSRRTNGRQIAYLDGIGKENFTKFKKSQENIIASAYEFQFGQEIRAINDSLATNKDRFQGLKSDYKNLPKQGDHWNAPSYKVSVNKSFTRVFNNVYNMVFNYGSFSYEDFKNGDAQKSYQPYFDNETKANIADDARTRYLKAHLNRLNGLVRDFTILQNRINSLISSAESANGVFSYGQIRIDDLKKMVSEIEELREDIQSGERPWWMVWRQRDPWSINSVLEAIKGMESYKKTRGEENEQLKKDYASAFKIYEKEEKLLELEKQKQAEEEKKAAAEEKAQALKKQKAEEDAVKQERAGWEAEKQAAAEKADPKTKSTDAFNVPFGESQKTTLSKSVPTIETTKPATIQTKPVPPPAQPSTQFSAQKKPTRPTGKSFIPHYYKRIAGFSFINQSEADMMVSDFSWNDDGINALGAGILKLGAKSIDDVFSVPTSGYEDGPYQPEVGHVYVIKTKGDKYGVIEITLIETDYLYFYWRYQNSDGSSSF